MNIIELAKEAGFEYADWCQAIYVYQEGAITEELERFAALVRAEALGENNGRTNNTCNEKCNSNFYGDSDLVPVSTKALADHSGDANEMVSEPVWILPGGGLVGKAEPVNQEPVAEVVLREQRVGFGREEERKDVKFLSDVKIGTKLYAAPAQPVKQEPVAWWLPKYKQVSNVKWADYCEPLYAAPVDAKAIRAEALEEAAKVCEEEAKAWARLNAQDEEGFGAMQCAAAIRGLK